MGPQGSSVERDEVIYVDTGEEIDPASVEFDIQPWVEGNLTTMGFRLEYDPSEHMVPGTEYRAVVSVSDLAGNQAGPFEWTFRIADQYVKGSVSGYVVDSYGSYVEGAVVIIGNITAITNTFGSFELEVMPGTYTIKIEKVGYTSFEGNFTLLPTQEMDLGKLEMEGGTPLDIDGEEDHQWMLYVAIAVLALGLAIGIIASTIRRSGKKKEAEE
jgi:hypothetical protein